MLTNRLTSFIMNSTDGYGQFVGYHAGEHVTDEYMEPWAFTATAVVLFFIGFFGFSLNLLVIVLMCKDIQVSVRFVK
jgi:hypothetical protein